ncbi:MAG: N-acetyl-alpha-D-glucosaminyl L-malate synthase BshA [Archangiaceae bacterium]|nr:N-acetyl-alpha-D-glucosaminyl L-malate synthase BshA [Archangiaceae bacterium]
MRIGLVCHATLGGSGVIATELGEVLARRGHEVHFFCASRPPRLRAGTLHEVRAPRHELFPGGEYALALASALAEHAAQLDVVHVHYAIPHATSAWLMRQLIGAKAPQVVTTVHGTDVLTLGADPALQPVVKGSLSASAAVTAPTRYLAAEAKRVFGVDAQVIGNFVDTAHFTPGKPTRTLLHGSNFRPLKRVGDVVRIFERVLKQVDARLVMVGDGPERAAVEAQAKGLPVTFVGEQADVAPLLREGAVFLFPSETESFGLAALEALACGVPVIASRTGGLPELIDDGVNGWLRPVGDVDGMAGRAVALLTDPDLHTRMSAAARESALQRWQPGPQVDRYEALYRALLT